MNLLKIEDFSLTLRGSDGRALPVLEQISLDLANGRCLGIAGESGSGKSVLAMSIAGLISQRSIIEKIGSIHFNGENISTFSESQLNKIRGKHIGFVFQEPMTAMNPLMTLFDQVSEVIYAHNKGAGKAEVKNQVRNALVSAGFGEPEKFYDSYPHQLSGGMRQRAMIAIGLALKPDLIIADEPTTAIDAALQVQLLKELRQNLSDGRRSMIFISHDLGVLRAVSDQLAILYAGNLVEVGPACELLQVPFHPYTRDLIGALPRLVPEKMLPHPIAGNLPMPDRKPVGCVYSDRCNRSRPECREKRPKLRQTGKHRMVSCFFP
ncbi:MAG: ABC transporter ATP-binding protein, partial [Candidatus Rifleibacteriota bacterium]